MNEREGVTRFVLLHQDASAPRGPHIDALCRVRDACVALRVVGQDDARYEGIGFGNVSVRDGDAFAITGTQTGKEPTLTPSHVSRVLRAAPEANRVWSEGPRPPSSESMTHAVIYREHSALGAVIHGHHPGVWRARHALQLPCTPANIPYGTPAMADAVAGLAAGAQAFAMDGHIDGFVVVGRDLDDALLALRALLDRSMRAERSR